MWNKIINNQEKKILNCSVIFFLFPGSKVELSFNVLKHFFCQHHSVLMWLKEALWREWISYKDWILAAKHLCLPHLSFLKFISCKDTAFNHFSFFTHLWDFVMILISSFLVSLALYQQLQSVSFLLPYWYRNHYYLLIQLVLFLDKSIC